MRAFQRSGSWVERTELQESKGPHTTTFPKHTSCAALREHARGINKNSNDNSPLPQASCMSHTTTLKKQNLCAKPRGSTTLEHRGHTWGNSKNPNVNNHSRKASCASCTTTTTTTTRNPFMRHQQEYHSLSQSLPQARLMPPIKVNSCAKRRGSAKPLHRTRPQRIPTGWCTHREQVVVMSCERVRPSRGPGRVG